jgi:hypothetical protein
VSILANSDTCQRPTTGVWELALYPLLDHAAGPAHASRPGHHAPPVHYALELSEKDAKLVQKLGQHQPFIAVFPHECMGQRASFGPA